MAGMGILVGVVGMPRSLSRKVKAVATVVAAAMAAMEAREGTVTPIRNVLERAGMVVMVQMAGLVETHTVWSSAQMAVEGQRLEMEAILARVGKEDQDLLAMVRMAHLEGLAQMERPRTRDTDRSFER